MIRKLKCLFFGHSTVEIEEAYYCSILVKVKCTRCGRYFCWSREAKSMLPWDTEFEQCFDVLRKVAYDTIKVK